MVIAKKRSLVGYAGALALFSGLSAVACNIVLGIGEATHDPSLDDAGIIDSGPPETGGGDSGDSGSGNGNDCNTYCSLIGKSCTGVNAEYLSDAVCQAICGTFDPGQPTDTTGASLGCRIHNAKLAAADPVTYCQKAGPLAGGGCTNACHSFCVLVDAICGTANIFPYEAGTCESNCAGYTYRLSTEEAGAIGDILFSTTNTLNCRLYHLESAANAAMPGALKFHCPHTASDSSTCN